MDLSRMPGVHQAGGGEVSRHNPGRPPLDAPESVASHQQPAGGSAEGQLFRAHLAALVLTLTRRRCAVARQLNAGAMARCEAERSPQSRLAARGASMLLHGDAATWSPGAQAQESPSISKQRQRSAWSFPSRPPAGVQTAPLAVLPRTGAHGVPCAQARQGTRRIPVRQVCSAEDLCRSAGARASPRSRSAGRAHH